MVMFCMYIKNILFMNTISNKAVPINFALIFY